jgi:hypothetical protein
MQATANRTLTISKLYRPLANGKMNAVPFIRMSGHWLAEAGFSQGDEIYIAIANGQIVITRKCDVQ